MIDALSLAIAQGNYFTTACQLCDIYPTTLYDWIHYAEEEIDSNKESIYTQLYHELKRAEAKSEAERVERVRQAGIGGQVSRRVTRIKRDGTEETEETFQLPQWIADMTFLERRHPDRWGRRDRRDVVASGNVTIEVQFIDRAPDRQIVEGESRELPMIVETHQEVR